MRRCPCRTGNEVMSTDISSTDISSTDISSTLIPDDKRNELARHIPQGEQLIMSGLATDAQVGAALEGQGCTGKRPGETTFLES